MQNYKVTVLGAGLAGCEAALWLAGKGVQVELYEQKPTHFSPAHKSEGFAELLSLIHIFNLYALAIEKRFAPKPVTYQGIYSFSLNRLLEVET